MSMVLQMAEIGQPRELHTYSERVLRPLQTSGQVLTPASPPIEVVHFDFTTPERNTKRQPSMRRSSFCRAQNNHRHAPYSVSERPSSLHASSPSPVPAGRPGRKRRAKKTLGGLEALIQALCLEPSARTAPRTSSPPSFPPVSHQALRQSSTPESSPHPHSSPSPLQLSVMGNDLSAYPDAAVSMRDGLSLPRGDLKLSFADMGSLLAEERVLLVEEQPMIFDDGTGLAPEGLRV